MAFRMFARKGRSVLSEDDEQTVCTKTILKTKGKQKKKQRTS